MNSSRRKMLKSSALAAGGLCSWRVLDLFAKPSDCCNTPDLEPDSYTVEKDRIVVDLNAAPSLAHPGHAAFISVPEREIELIIVRPDRDSYVALSRFCTHGGQVLSYVRQRRLLQCNNYNHSLFELDGTVYKGPAPKPLARFRAAAAAGELTIYM